MTVQHPGGSWYSRWQNNAPSQAFPQMETIHIESRQIIPHAKLNVQRAREISPGFDLMAASPLPVNIYPWPPPCNYLRFYILVMVRRWRCMSGSSGITGTLTLASALFPALLLLLAILLLCPWFVVVEVVGALSLSSLWLQHHPPLKAVGHSRIIPFKPPISRFIVASTNLFSRPALQLSSQRKKLSLLLI